MPTIYTPPDAVVHSRNPAGFDQFPYGRFNKENTDNIFHPAGFSVPFTDEQYEIPVISRSRLLDNIDPEQKKEVLNNANSYLAIVPYGAGQGWASMYPNAKETILNFIRGVDLPGMENLDLVLGRKAKKMDRYFDHPWPLFLSGFSKNMKDFLLDQAVFPLREPGATFFVYALDEDKPNWFWLGLKGDAVRDGEEHAIKALASFKQKVWSNDKVQRVVRNFISQNPNSDLAKNSSNVLHATVNLTESLRIVYVDTDNHRGKDDPRYIILGLPISSSKIEQESLKGQIKTIPQYLVGARFMFPDSREIGCVWCKSDLHPGHSCPYPNVGEGWYGPSTDDLKKLVTRTKAWKGARDDEERSQRKDTKGRSSRDSRAESGPPSAKTSTNQRGRGHRESYHNDRPSRSYYDFRETDHSNNGHRRNRDEYKHSRGEGSSRGQTRHRGWD